MPKWSFEFRERFMAGVADNQEIIEALAEAIKTREILSARGYYRITARILIDNGYIDDEGNIL